MPGINLAEVAAEARALLRRDGNYWRTVLAIALMMALTNVPVILLNYLPVLLWGAGELTEDALLAIDTRAMVFSLMLQVLVTPAIRLGLLRYELNMCQGRPASPMELFEGLTRGNYFAAVRAMLWQTLSLFVWLMIPLSMAANGLVLLMAYGQTSGMLWLGLGLTLFIMVNRALAYSQQFYLLAREPRMGAIISLKLSTTAMRGRLGELFCLKLRYFYCFLVLALPSLLSGVLVVWARLGLELSAFDQALVGLATTLATIVLASLCMPRLEIASAVYFTRLSDMMSRRAEELKRAHNAAFDEAMGRGDALPGWGDPTGGDEQPDDSAGDGQPDDPTGSGGRDAGER